MSDTQKPGDHEDPFGFGKPREPKEVDPNDPFGFMKKPDSNVPEISDSHAREWLESNVGNNSPIPRRFGAKENHSTMRGTDVRQKRTRPRIPNRLKKTRQLSPCSISNRCRGISTRASS